MKNLYAILAVITLAACGGGAGDDAGGNTNGGGGGGGGDQSGPVSINEPIVGDGTFTTISSSVEISGSAFVSPSNVDCVNVFPIQLSMSWRNAATGQSGPGAIGSVCQNTFLGLLWSSRWTIPAGTIDLQLGENPIAITITDNQGTTGTANITINLLEDNAAPIIAGSTPAPGAVDVPVNRSISVRFNEDMLRSSLTGERFTVSDPSGNIVDGFRTYDGNNFNWTLDPQTSLLFSTEYTVTISGDVEDAHGGNIMGADESWSFVTAPNPDVTPPQVTEVSPVVGSQCVSPDARAIASFDEALNSSSVNDATFTLRTAGGDAVQATVTYADATARLEPLLPLIGGTDYEATLAATIEDLAGNALGADFSWSFRTTSNALPGEWEQTNPIGAPFERRNHSAVWTGSEVIFWGGYGWIPGAGFFGDTNTGARYNPATDTWAETSTDGMVSLDKHTAVWTGSEMIVWGGGSNYGGRYDPGTDSWQQTTLTNAPTGRDEHAAVWTGTEMIIWGGESSSSHTLNSGGRYNPSTDTWTAMSTDGAPSPRRDMAYAWTGSEFIVWGGISRLSGGVFLVDGARYNPATDTWAALPDVGARSGTDMIGVWTGTEMIVWNGGMPSFVGSDGFPRYEPTLHLYNPSTDSWRATNSLCEPYLGASGNEYQWTGSKLFVLGHGSSGGYFYDPTTDDWQGVSTDGGPAGRFDTASAWAGDTFVLWGGRQVDGLQDSGFVYRP